MDNVNKLYNIIYKELKKYGAIKWHTSKYGSKYIKFKDTRIGSIRFSDHNGRQRYNYTYEINIDSNIEDANTIIESIINKTKSIIDFDNKKFIVYKNGYGYITLENMEQYRKAILKKEFP